MARSIPNNQEAEKALLSSMFISKYALDKANDSLDEDSFYYDSNRIIFKTLIHLASTNQPIDVTSVVSELKSNDKLNDIGIKCVNYNLFFNTNIKIIIFLLIILFI